MGWGGGHRVLRRAGGRPLDNVRGGEAFRGVVIDGDQVIPLALSVFSALGIVLDDDPGG